jgi:hypothetical protein
MSNENSEARKACPAQYRAGINDYKCTGSKIRAGLADAAYNVGAVERP